MTITVKDLKKKILNMDVNEAKEPLLYLCLAIEEHQLSVDDPLIQQTEVVIQRIEGLLNAIKSDDFEWSKLSQSWSSLHDAYQDLYQTSNLGQYSKRLKKAALQLCGAVVALLTAVPVGLFCTAYFFFFFDQYNFSTPMECFKYFLTGALLGTSLSFRYIESFENSLDRQLRSAMKGLSYTFSSLQGQLQDKHFLNHKEALLSEWFSDDSNDRETFLTGEFPYHIVAFQAEFLSSNMKGAVGHHATLVFSIKGQSYILETGPSSLKEVTAAFEERKQKSNPQACVNQVIERKCTGETLLNMLVMHQLLQQRYAIELKNMPHLISVYKPGEHDCHSYVDKILASVDEPMSELERAYDHDFNMGKQICSWLKRFGTFQRKPDYVALKNPDVNAGSIEPPTHERPALAG